VTEKHLIFAASWSSPDQMPDQATTNLERTLLLSVARHIDGEAIDESMNGSSGEVQRPEKPLSASGLLQAPLGQIAELLEPWL
jgi:hypothetical protein